LGHHVDDKSVVGDQNLGEGTQVEVSMLVVRTVDTLGSIPPFGDRIHKPASPPTAIVDDVDDELDSVPLGIRSVAHNILNRDHFAGTVDIAALVYLMS